MEKFFNALYNCIYNLGLITGKIIGSFFKKIGKIIKKLFHFNKASFSSAKVFFKRAIISVIVLAIIGTTVYVASSNSNKIKAVSLEIDGEVIGYATSQTQADSAETMAIEILGDAGAKKVKNNEVRTDACNIKSASVLSDIIVEKLSEGRVIVPEGLTLSKLDAGANFSRPGIGNQSGTSRNGKQYGKRNKGNFKNNKHR